MPDWSLAGKVAIVTGASPGGIGEVYARTIADAGAAVLVADVVEGAASAVAESIGESATATSVDITDEAAVAAMAQLARDELGGIDNLVNNAALMEQVGKGPVLEFSLEDWNRAFAVNLTGAFLCSRAVVPSMRERGGGRIVNQISAAAYPPVTVYSLTKHALAGLTVALARELGPSNISVNGIAPGMVESAAGKRQIETLAAGGVDIRAHVQTVVAKRASGEREDLAGALSLLVSPAGDWITGQVLHVDGGWVLTS